MSSPLTDSQRHALDVLDTLQGDPNGVAEKVREFQKAKAGTDHLVAMATDRGALLEGSLRPGQGGHE